MNLSSTQIKFVITQGFCNGYHSTQWYANNKLVWSSTCDQALPAVLEFAIQLPCIFKIVVAGKNMMTDTLLQDDKILADKFVEITEILLAGYPIKQSVLYNVCKYHSDDGKTFNSTYCHSNGVLEIEFHGTDPVEWHLLNNH